jgi:hypothetical protein
MTGAAECSELLRGPLHLIACLVLMLAPLTCAAENGLVAHYKFDEGKGAIAGDSSGGGNAGAIHGARWIKVASGYALEFDGADDYVDCGDSPSLDIRGPITTTFWVCPAGRQPAHEPGILGKHFTSYLVTYYMNRHLYWYINSGGNNAHATVPPGRWSHVATTFDGKLMRIYVNGALAAEHVSQVPTLRQGGRFFIGSVMGDPEGTDPNYRVSGAFKGCIGDVRVYNRALSEGEIRAQFSTEELMKRNAMFASPYSAVRPARRIQSGGMSVAVGKNGEVQINYGGSSCVITSEYSYPGKKIGWNALASENIGAEPAWKPRLKGQGDSSVLLRASGRYYGLTRIVCLRRGRVQIQDTLTNRRDSPVAVLIRHRVTMPQAVENAVVMNSAAAPLIFFSQNGADWGILAEDDIGRLQFDASCVANRAEIHHSNFALDTGKSYTFRYAVYPMKRTGDVYDLVNRVRRDSKANFTIEGPFAFFDAASPMLTNRPALTTYLRRRNLRVVALSPWLDYDPGSMDRVISRDEYKALAQQVARTLRQVSPGIKVLGCIECDWVNIVPDKMTNGHLISTGTPQQVAKVIADANLPWKDSTKRDRDGTVRIEYYKRGGKPQFSLGVYPAPGNYHHRFLLEQAAFLLDHVGLDGFYIDEFSQAWGGTIRDYSRWDGFSVDVDPATGEIAQGFADCGLVGKGPRLDIIRCALNRRKNITANTYSTTLAEQSLPAQRFAETQGSTNLDLARPGEKPPFVDNIFAGVLGSPIGLGALPSSGQPDLAQGLMLTLISYLRHGLLYYHYAYPDLPEAGPGSGEYGPINRMFPFTPIELHEGWVKGRERIIAAASLSTRWAKPSRPRVFLFDLHGRQAPTAGKAELRRIKDGLWQITLRLNDWSEIAIIE